MEKKYQVFVSSTFTDLQEERKKILDILLMADCIPAGMEAFVAADVEQFEVIKKVIDLCDYYVLIIGKRYGSLHPETGISYTEMEYDYAIEKGIPVLVFALDPSVEVTAEKQESDPIKAQKLQAFRTKAMNNRLASVWLTRDDLTGKLAVSIMKAKTEISRPGWRRGADFDEGLLRREMMVLKDENTKLRNELVEKQKTIEQLSAKPNLAFEDCQIGIDYSYYDDVHKRRFSSTLNTTLKKVFLVIATQMMDVMISEVTIHNTLLSQLPFKGSLKTITDHQVIKRLLNQFKALSLIQSQWNDEQKILFWGLTFKGTRVRDEAILIQKE